MHIQFLTTLLRTVDVVPPWSNTVVFLLSVPEICAALLLWMLLFGPTTQRWREARLQRRRNVLTFQPRPIAEARARELQRMVKLGGER